MRVIYPVTATLIKLVPLIALTFLPWLCLLTNLQRTMVAPCWLSTTTIVLSYCIRIHVGMKWKCEKRGKCIGSKSFLWRRKTLTDNVQGSMIQYPAQDDCKPVRIQLKYLHGRIYLVIHNRTGKSLLCLGFLVSAQQRESSALSPAVLLFVFHTINLPVTRDI